MANKRREFLKSTAALTALGAAPVGLAVAASESPTQVARQVLGSTGAQIPILQLGTAQQLDPVYDKVMHRCARSGVTALDTALSYGWGSSHRAIAVFLEQLNDRKSLWLTSKSGKRDVSGLIQDIDKALAELRTDYLDLYLMHGIRDPGMLDAPFLAGGDQLRRSGKTRFFGFSCHDGNVVDLMNRAAQAGAGAIDVILFRYNFRRYGDRDLNVAIDNCHRAGIGLMAMKTMGSIPAEIEAVAQFRSNEFTLAQAKLKSVWADERIATVVSEMDSVRVARENIAAALSTNDLAASDLHQLNRLAALTAQYACNGCSHLCEAATGDDTAIADQLRYLSYAECYAKPARARELYAALPPQARAMDSAALSRAAAVCPQGIDIPARLAQARRVLLA